VEDDFDQIERLTRRVGRAALVGVPTWILLLALLPFTGMGVTGCLLVATVLAVAAIVVAERLRGRPQAGPAGAPRSRRGPLSPLAAAGLTLAAVLLVVYVIFVVRAA